MRLALLDVNVLVHAHRVEHADHERCRLALDEPGPALEIGLTMPVVNGFLRLVTHPGVFARPTPMSLGLQVVEEWAARPSVRWISPGDGHFFVFRELCLRYGASGNAVYDLHLAALAIEHGAVLWSLDSGFARVRELDWRNPTDRR
ncbi:MAG: PIN domain-containing protein [Myxococcales bacterium]|nr:PIN domain-containing protein [Myxococcales bacterium]